MVALNGATTKTLSYTGETIYNTWECVYEYTDTDKANISVNNGAIVVSANYGYALTRIYKLPIEVTSKLIIGCIRKEGKLSYGSYGVTTWDGSSTETLTVISLVNGTYPSYTLTVTNNYSKSASSFTVPVKSYNNGLSYFSLLSAFSGTSATVIKNTAGLSSIAPTHLMINIYGANPYSYDILAGITFNYLA